MPYSPHPHFYQAQAIGMAAHHRSISIDSHHENHVREMAAKREIRYGEPTVGERPGVA